MVLIELNKMINWYSAIIMAINDNQLIPKNKTLTIINVRKYAGQLKLFGNNVFKVD
jgi:hypothetical protein